MEDGPVELVEAAAVVLPAAPASVSPGTVIPEGVVKRARGGPLGHCAGRFTPCEECAKKKRIKIRAMLARRRKWVIRRKRRRENATDKGEELEGEEEEGSAVIPLPGLETPGLKAEVVNFKTEEERRAKIIRDLDEISVYMTARIKDRHFQDRLIKKPHSFFKDLMSLLVCRARLVDGSSTGITIDLGSILERESKILAKLKDEFGDQADAIAKRFERVQNPKLGETGRRSETVVWPGDVETGDAEERRDVE